MTYRLRTHHDPILRQRCEPVPPDADLGFVQAMRELCQEHHGIGLAAPQIGVALRVVLVKHLVMVNPVITWFGPVKRTEHEGCLSYPGVRTPVERSVRVKVTFENLRRERVERAFALLEARIVQHEVDHLDGVCRVRDAWRARR